MPDTNLISELVRGEDRSLPRTVDLTSIDGDSLSKAWLTVKTSPHDADADAIFQKIITPVLNADGQIDSVGGGSPIQSGHLYFLIPSADTLKLVANVFYFYDIKALSSGSAKKVLETGKIVATEQVTIADS